MSLEIEIGTYEGHPIIQTISDEMVQDMEADGFTQEEIIE